MKTNSARDFVPSHISTSLRLRRLKVFLQHVTSVPASMLVRAPHTTGKWALYFVYSITGEIFEQHVFTIDRLKASGFKVLVVIGSAQIGNRLPDDLKFADAVIVKDEHGFDFSGYAIGLRYLVHRFEEVDVLLLNDSVFGPFRDLMALLAETPWRLTGFTCSSAVEHHIQSYAFAFRGLDRNLLASLESVFFRHCALNFHGAVSYLQETRLARRASRVCSVGTLWSSDEPSTDLTMANPLEFVDEGFPFLKRSLLGKFSSHFHRDAVLSVLRDKKHPTSVGKLFAGFGV
jgi:lipopolysaccharide biosynthesis protein